MSESVAKPAARPRRIHQPRLRLGWSSRAISAGAYTAGVVDFLIQALDEFDAVRRSGEASCPKHEIRLRVVAGASAGGMTAALLAGLAHERFQHAENPDDDNPVGNTLFDSWVNRIDAKFLLGDSDLKADPKVRSLLDSTAIHEIAATALRAAPEGSLARGYLKPTRSMSC